MTSKKELTDFLFLLGMGLAGAGLTAAGIRGYSNQRSANGKPPLSPMVKGAIQISTGVAAVVLFPNSKIWKLGKLAGFGAVFAGAFNLAQNWQNVPMLAGPGGANKRLTREQVLYLVQGGMNGPATMRPMNGPATMRPMNGGAGTRPAMMGTSPGMMGRSGAGFRASV
jgi:hypothetical protein